MKELKYNKISKSDLLKLSEDNVLFITNPGRMGDEDGSTFVVKDNDELTIYRVNGWMYPINNEENEISFDDMAKQFPMWIDSWNNANNKNYKGKYKYIYMGFGNGLSVDNSIYNDYEPYLNKLVEERLDNYSEDERNNLKYSTIFNVWENALDNMAKDKKYILK